jgi:hemerythrin
MTRPILEWNDNYLIGIDELDFEHKRLIEDIKLLHEELVRHDEKSTIERCLGDIFARMQAHFALEERVMIKNDYPFYDEHKCEHEDLLESYTQSMLDFMNATNWDSGDKLERVLNQWIMEHILISDKKMSAMIHG